MKFVQIAKLIKEEVKGKEIDLFIEKFLGGYNSLLDQMNSILNGNLTTSQNMKSKTFDYSNVAGSVLASKTITWTLNEAPTEVRLARLYEVSGTPLAAAPWLTWSYDLTKKEITVKISGLVAASYYTVSLIAQV